MDEILKQAYKEAIEEDGLTTVVGNEVKTFVKHPNIFVHMLGQMGCGCWSVIIFVIVVIALYLMGGAW